jgi:hypothetical protein
MKKITLIAIVAFISLNCLASAEYPISTLINIAAKQRALSQRIFKSWVCAKNNVAKELSDREINVSTETFGSALDLIIENVDDKNTKSKFALVKVNWDVYKTMVNNKDNSDYDATLNACNKVLLTSQNALDQLIIYANANKKTSDGTYDYATVVSLTEVCGRQRYLTQRFTMYYNLHYFGFCASQNPLAVAQGVLLQIDANFKKLLISEYNTTEIYDELSMLMIEWKIIYKKYNDNIAKKAIEPLEMFDTMNKYFGKFDKITQQYNNLLKN